MAIISKIFYCPRCDSEITSIHTAIACPKCGLPLGNQPSAPYSPPYTFTEQHEKYQDKETYVETLLNLPIEKANSILNDALSLIELLPGKKNSVSDIRFLVEMSIKIGEIAKHYHRYLEEGGKHVPTFFIKHQQNQENQNEPTETNRNGANAPTSIAISS